MATRLHLLTLAEQRQRRQDRRTNWRLLFVVGLIGLMAFLVGSITGCGGSVEATAEERVAPPVSCGSEQACPRVG
jgi:hypothetical protein